MAAKSRTVKWQKVREVRTKKKYGGEKSAYWIWFDKSPYSKHGEDDGRPPEPALANPDMVEEPTPNPENVTRKILKKALTDIKFSPKERAILKLIETNHTQEAIAKLLGISRSRVAQALLRIQKKGSKWLGNKVAHGSLISRAEEEGETE